MLTASVSAAPAASALPAVEGPFDIWRAEFAGHCLGVAVLGALVLWGLEAEPPVRGFFCADASIRFPLSAETVPAGVASVLVVGVPLAVIAAGEWLQRKLRALQEEAALVACGGETSAREAALSLAARRAPLSLPRSRARKRRLWFLECSAENPLAPLGRAVYGLAFALLLSLSLATVAKLCVGRLRPHFLAACDVDWESVKCEDAQGHPALVQEYTCRNPDAGVVKEARLSFFSAHSSNAFAAIVFTIAYLQLRFRARAPVVEECWCGLCLEEENVEAEASLPPPPPQRPCLSSVQTQTLDGTAAATPVVVTYVPPKKRARRRRKQLPLTPSAVAALRGAAPLLQAALLLLATFIALSRVLDSFHHPSDVLAGVCVGAASGLFSALCVCKLQNLQVAA